MNRIYSFKKMKWVEKKNICYFKYSINTRLCQTLPHLMDLQYILVIILFIITSQPNLTICSPTFFIFDLLLWELVTNVFLVWKFLLFFFRANCFLLLFVGTMRNLLYPVGDPLPQSNKRYFVKYIILYILLTHLLQWWIITAISIEMDVSLL